MILENLQSGFSYLLVPVIAKDGHLVIRLLPISRTLLIMMLYCALPLKRRVYKRFLERMNHEPISYRAYGHETMLKAIIHRSIIFARICELRHTLAELALQIDRNLPFQPLSKAARKTHNVTTRLMSTILDRNICEISPLAIALWFSSG